MHDTLCFRKPKKVVGTGIVAESKSELPRWYLDKGIRRHVKILR